MKGELEPTSLTALLKPSACIFCPCTSHAAFYSLSHSGMWMREDGWSLEEYVNFVLSTSMISSFDTMHYIFPPINSVLNGGSQSR